MLIYWLMRLRWSCEMHSAIHTWENKRTCEMPRVTVSVTKRGRGRASVEGVLSGFTHNVADLLLLELDVRVVHAVVELLLEGEAVEIDLELEELVLERFLLLHAELGQQAAVVGVRVDRRPHRLRK